MFANTLCPAVQELDDKWENPFVVLAVTFQTRTGPLSRDASVPTETSRACWTPVQAADTHGKCYLFYLCGCNFWVPFTLIGGSTLTRLLNLWKALTTTSRACALPGKRLLDGKSRAPSCMVSISLQKCTKFYTKNRYFLEGCSKILVKSNQLIYVLQFMCIFLFISNWNQDSRFGSLQHAGMWLYISTLHLGKTANYQKGRSTFCWRK